MKEPADREQGQVLVAFVLTATFLLAMIGLAIDVGMAYLVKTKLSAAVDAAALAAGKVAPQGQESAGAEAARFFSVNYPDGLLGARVAAPTTVVMEEDQSWNVTVSATALLPSYFAKAVGARQFTVSASATSTLSPVDLVLVLATPERPGDQALEAAKAAAGRFLENFNPESDRVGLIRFASGVEARDEFRIREKRGFDLRRMQDYLAGPETREPGYAAAGEALRVAKAQLDSLPKPRQSKQRLIVLFAAGAPNGMAARFETGAGGVVGALSSQSDGLYPLYDRDEVSSPLRRSALPFNTLPETDWSGTVSVKSFNAVRELLPVANSFDEQRCNVDRAARNMAENVADAARGESGLQGYPITIHTIGRGSKLSQLEVACPSYGNNEKGENIMRRLANVNGVDTYNANQPSGMYVAAEPETFDAAFRKVAASVLRLSR